MTTTPKATEPGTLVTVTITDTHGAEHTFIGTSMGTAAFVVQTWEDTTGTRYNHVPTTDIVGKARPDLGEGVDFLHVYSATGNPFPVATVTGWPGTLTTDRIDPTGPDWFFGLYDFHVRVDSDKVDVRLATKSSREWVNANLSLDARRTRFIERITALDPALGEEADRLIEAIADDAFERGETHEWHINND